MAVSDNVWIGDLPPEITKAEVDQIFGAYGNVTQSKVMPPKQPGQKASAMIRYATVEEAQWLVTNLNNNLAEGLPEDNPIKVKFANDNSGGNGLKTRLCTFFLNGNCTSPNCAFAHSEAELGTPINGIAALGQPAQEGGKGGGKLFVKTKMCMHFQSGTCTRGPACWFAHDAAELGVQQLIPDKGGKGAPYDKGGKGGPIVISATPSGPYDQGGMGGPIVISATPGGPYDQGGKGGPYDQKGKDFGTLHDMASGWTSRKGKGCGKQMYDFQGLLGLAIPIFKQSLGANAKIPPEQQIYVANLPPDTTDEGLYQLFAPFGALAPEGVKAMKNPDGSCKGIGFIDFLAPESAQNAVTVLDKLGGSLTVSLKNQSRWSAPATVLPDGSQVWGTDGAQAWGSDGTQMWSANGAQGFSTEGAQIFSTDGAQAFSTDGAHGFSTDTNIIDAAQA